MTCGIALTFEVTAPEIPKNAGMLPPGLEILRGMDSLRIIGTGYEEALPAAEWKKLAAGEFKN
jgi:hypothetical protein